ncbi:plasmid maintenance system antidote protein [Sphingobacterium sp. ML3W]|uniref:helix-turn-helix transcriptional regulator n=1 Tax=Sphingobacterium sp. ML3W TaxID=1538644 RepID=UPI0004F617CF|nr:plasmid maintenance system antidote protein [Sphingobacterium sp. ML3W]AIM36894.1 plasmid maintenance system antidote protein [Sphingobacterium sp. ML3W]
MERSLERFKGIHPGIILERELKKRAIKPSPFALSIDTHRQIFNAIIKGKRGIPVPLSLKVDKALGIEEGTFALLQTYYDIERAKDTFLHGEKPNLNILRKILFWDTDMNKIDWQKQSKAVIQRVFERGSQEEQNEITRFYGDNKIQNALVERITEPMSLHKH